MLTSFISSAALGQARLSADTDDIIIGDSDTTFHADADDNIAIGINALDATSGAATQNVAIGTNTLTALQTGDYNVAIGYHAGAALSDQVGGCVIIGREALSQATSGIDECISIGYRSMHNITSGEAVQYCVAIGTSTLRGEMVAASSGTVAIGHKALNSLTDAVGNVAIGYEALLGHTTGVRNIAIGYGAMNDTDANDCPTSTDNIFIGYDAGGGTWVTNDSNFNVGIGNYCMDDAMDGALGNTAVGHSAMSDLTAGGYNVAVGYEALDNLETGEKNTAVGYQALTTYNNSGSGNNTAVGFYAGGIVSSGKSNTVIGSYAGALLTTGSNNTIVGYYADVDVNSDSYQTRLGSYGAVKYKSGRFSLTAAHSGVNSVIKECFKIPALSIITNISCTVVTKSTDVNPYTLNLQLSTSTGTSADGALANAGTTITVPELLGAGASNTYQQNSGIAMAGTAADILAGTGGVDKTVYLNRPNTTIVGTADTYLYVCNAVNNGISDTSAVVLEIVVEYFGID